MSKSVKAETESNKKAGASQNCARVTFTLRPNPADSLPPFPHTVHDRNCGCQPKKERKGVSTEEFHRLFRNAIREAGGVLVHPKNAKAMREALDKEAGQ